MLFKARLTLEEAVLPEALTGRVAILSGLFKPANIRVEGAIVAITRKTVPGELVSNVVSFTDFHKAASE